MNEFDDDVDLPTPDESLQEAVDAHEAHFLPATRTLARHAFLAACPAHLRRRLQQTGSFALVIKAPTPSWVPPLKAALRQLYAWDLVYAPAESSKSRRDVEERERDIVQVLAGGGRVLGIAFSPQQALPEVLRTSSDAFVEMTRITDGTIVRAIEEATGSRPRRIPENVGATLDFPEIAAAIRIGEGAARAVRRLEAAMEVRSVPEPLLASLPSVSDLNGYGDAKTWALSLLRDLESWRRGELDFGQIEKHVVLASAPGLGKTTLVQSIAQDATLPLFTTSVGGWFTRDSGHLGDVISSISDFFLRASLRSPCIAFIDELDAVPSRTSLSRHNSDWWTPVVTHLLMKLDSSVSGEIGKVIIIGATNFPERLDPALIRPGRLSRIIRISPPDATDLAKILRQHLGPELPGTDLEGLVQAQVGATGADAMGWVKAARQKARQQGRRLTFLDLQEQIAPPDQRSTQDLWRSAIHEAAHAVASHVLATGSLAHVTLQARGGSGGRTTVEMPPQSYFTREQIENQTMVALAGRAAEEEVLGRATTGAGGAANSDLSVATLAVAALHASFGLGGSLLYRTNSEAAANLLQVDPDLRREVEMDLKRLYASSLELVRTHRVEIEKVARLLVDQRIIDGAQFARLIASKRGGSTQKRRP